MKFPSKKLKHITIQHSVEYIRRELGVDVGEKERQQLLPEMIDEADLTIVITEKEQWPVYLKEGGKIVFWDIPDGAGQDDVFVYEVFTQVRRRVEQLVAEIG